ncbi:MAG TPA: 4Fe-4S dicluster domain-containing protein, partial [Roseimicrobium sp.]|nr:4Fe-4S dicluster domain-containing protein [Roseimicrobium sp.]
GATIAAEILTQLGHKSSASALSSLAAPLAAIEKAGIKDAQKWAVECAKDLIANKGTAVVVAGYRQPLAVHVLAHAINFALESVDKTVSYFAAPESREGTISALAGELNAGKVESLVILGGNPVYTAPADIHWAAAQSKAKELIRLGYYEDESFPSKGWHLAEAHYLESWGDVRTADGTIVAVQPLIEPLFAGVTAIEVMARFAGLPKIKAHDIVLETFGTYSKGGDEAWKKFLHDGFVAGTSSLAAAVQFDWVGAGKALAEFVPAPMPSKDKLEVVFYRSASVDDGRFNNNGWMQETPDPITKITWDNAILLSPATAKELGVGIFDYAAKGPKTDRGLFLNQVVEVTVNGLKVKGAVWIQPGMADNSVGLTLGYGREKTGRIGRLKDGRPAGYNAYSVRSSKNLSIATGATLTGTAETYQLASTQEHGAMEGRPIVREGNKAQFEKTPGFAKNMDLESEGHSKHIAKDAQGRPLTIYPIPALTGMHQWGMSIDLNSCVGCSACAVACQSENNVPIVGKEQVTKGREMAWIRLDRYYAGTVENPQVAYLPMLCQHCENAPCESVCPVNATAHDEEGLNVMAYNRCVGTRYCSNNCPYKVRRFNYFDYSRRNINELYRSPFSFNKDGSFELFRWFKEPEKGSKPEDEWELLKLVRNPDVSMRMRGIMEKCSFCVQRIEQAKIARKTKAGASGDVRVLDGTIKTACEQACPAEAIVFGDVSDPASRVSVLKKQERDYSVLGFLDTRPRTTYLARIRNPNPAMPGYSDSPESLNEYETKREDNPFKHHDKAPEGGHAVEGKPAAHEQKGAH